MPCRSNLWSTPMPFDVHSFRKRRNILTLSSFSISFIFLVPFFFLFQFLFFSLIFFLILSLIFLSDFSILFFIPTSHFSFLSSSLPALLLSPSPFVPSPFLTSDLISQFNLPSFSFNCNHFVMLLFCLRLALSVTSSHPYSPTPYSLPPIHHPLSITP